MCDKEKIIDVAKKVARIIIAEAPGEYQLEYLEQCIIQAIENAEIKEK